MQKSIPIGPERVKRPNTARTSKFVLLNKSTKLGFGYRPQNETFDEPEQPEQSDNDDSPDDSQEESDQIDAPVAKRRKISLTAVPQRRSSRVANLKMSSSMVQRGRSKSISKVDERAPKSKSKTTEKKGKTTKHRNRSRSSTRSRSKSARSKKSNKSKTAPKNKRATKRRLSHSSKK